MRSCPPRLDAEDRFPIAWQPDEEDALSRLANQLARQLPTHAAILSLGSCVLRAAERDPGDIENERCVSALFDRAEKACPSLFRGQTALTEPYGKEWIETHGNRVILARYLVLSYFDFGPLSAWERGDPPLPEVCRQRR